jgi:hypothetical protein
VFLAVRFGGGTTIPGTFTFSAPGAVSYTYTFNDEAAVTVPAGADGAATVTLTPLHAYSQTLLVTGTFGDGTQSETRRYGFYANQITPQPQPSLASTEPQKTPLSQGQCGFVTQSRCGELFLSARSVNALGLASDELSTGFSVDPGPGDRTVREVRAV